MRMSYEVDSDESHSLIFTKPEIKSFKTMHIETELDDVYAERLLELQKQTNKPLPQLVAEMLAKAIDETPAPMETEGQKVLRILEVHQLLGCMEDDARLSVDYKRHLWGHA